MLGLYRFKPHINFLKAQDMVLFAMFLASYRHWSHTFFRQVPRMRRPVPTATPQAGVFSFGRRFDIPLLLHAHLILLIFLAPGRKLPWETLPKFLRPSRRDSPFIRTSRRLLHRTFTCGASQSIFLVVCFIFWLIFNPSISTSDFGRLARVWPNKFGFHADARCFPHKSGTHGSPVGARAAAELSDE